MSSIPDLGILTKNNYSILRELTIPIKESTHNKVYTNDTDYHSFSEFDDGLIIDKKRDDLFVIQSVSSNLISLLTRKIDNKKENELKILEEISRPLSVREVESLQHDLPLMYLTGKRIGSKDKSYLEVLSKEVIVNETLEKPFLALLNSLVPSSRNKSPDLLIPEITEDGRKVLHIFEFGTAEHNGNQVTSDKISKYSNDFTAYDSSEFEIRILVCVVGPNYVCSNSTNLINLVEKDIVKIFTAAKSIKYSIMSEDVFSLKKEEQIASKAISDTINSLNSPEVEIIRQKLFEYVENESKTKGLKTFDLLIKDQDIESQKDRSIDSSKVKFMMSKMMENGFESFSKRFKNKEEWQLSLQRQIDEEWEGMKDDPRDGEKRIKNKGLFNLKGEYSSVVKFPFLFKRNVGSQFRGIESFSDIKEEFNDFKNVTENMIFQCCTNYTQDIGESMTEDELIEESRLSYDEYKEKSGDRRKKTYRTWFDFKNLNSEDRIELISRGIGGSKRSESKRDESKLSEEQLKAESIKVVSRYPLKPYYKKMQEEIKQDEDISKHMMDFSLFNDSKRPLSSISDSLLDESESTVRDNFMIDMSYLFRNLIQQTIYYESMRIISKINQELNISLRQYGSSSGGKLPMIIKKIKGEEIVLICKQFSSSSNIHYMLVWRDEDYEYKELPFRKVNKKGSFCYTELSSIDRHKLSFLINVDEGLVCNLVTWSDLMSVDFYSLVRFLKSKGVTLDLSWLLHLFKESLAWCENHSKKDWKREYIINNSLSLFREECIRTLPKERLSVTSNILTYYLKRDKEMSFSSQKINTLIDENVILDSIETTIVTMLIWLEHKRQTSTSLQLVRYSYMDIFNDPSQGINPFKVGMCTNPRSRLLRFLLHKFRVNFSRMCKVLPRWSNRTINNEINFDKRNDKIDNLLNWITGRKIDNFELALNLSYLGYFFNKDSLNPNTDHYRVFDKIISEELKLRESRTKFMGEENNPNWKENAYKSHEFSVDFVRLIGQRIKREIGGSKTINNKIYSLFTKQASLINPLNTATLKASAKEEDLTKTFDEILIDKIMSNRGRSDKKEKESDVLNEDSMSLSDLIKKYKIKIKSESSIKVGERVLERLRVNRNLLHPLEESGEFILDIMDSKKGLQVKLFMKNQIGPPREIFILTYEGRASIYFAETLSRSLCSAVKNEMMTKKDLKYGKIRNFMRESQQSIMNKEHEVYEHLFCSDDNTTWAQQFVMKVFAFMYFEILYVDGNDWSKKLFKVICDVLNMVTMKKLLLPKELLSDFSNNSHFISSNENILSLYNQWTGLDSNNDLTDVRSLYLRNASNMMQGILHYTSSLLHSGYMLLVEDFSRILYKPIFRACINVDKEKNKIADSTIIEVVNNSMINIDSLVSSDDSHLTIFLSSKINGLNDVILRRSIKTCLLLLAHVKAGNYHLISAKRSVKKSATFVLQPISEFNSTFYVKNQTLTPLIKFVRGCLTTPLDLSLENRQIGLSNLRKQLLENGASSLVIKTVERSQGKIYYKSLGSDVNDLFNYYSTLVQRIKHPSIGYFLIEPDISCVTLGYEFSLYSHMKICKETRSMESLIYKELLNDMTKTGKPTFNLMFYLGGLSKYKDFLKRLNIPENWKINAILDPFTYCFSKENNDAWVYRITRKFFSNGVNRSFNFETLGAIYSTAVYSLNTPSYIVKEITDEEIEKPSNMNGISSPDVEVLENSGFWRKKSNTLMETLNKRSLISILELLSERMLDLDSKHEISLSNLSSLYSGISHYVYTEEENKANFSNKSSTYNHGELKPSYKRIKLSYQKGKDSEIYMPAQNILTEVWKNQRRVGQAYSQFLKLKSLFPWLQETAEDTIKNDDCPFSSVLDILEMTKELDKSQTSITSIMPVSSFKSWDNFFRDSFKYNYSRSLNIGFDNEMFDLDYGQRFNKSRDACSRIVTCPILTTEDKIQKLYDESDKLQRSKMLVRDSKTDSNLTIRESKFKTMMSFINDIQKLTNNKTNLVRLERNENSFEYKDNHDDVLARLSNLRETTVFLAFKEYQKMDSSGKYSGFGSLRGWIGRSFCDVYLDTDDRSNTYVTSIGVISNASTFSEDISLLWNDFENMLSVRGIPKIVNMDKRYYIRKNRRPAWLISNSGVRAFDKSSNVTMLTGKLPVYIEVNEANLDELKDRIVGMKFKLFENVGRIIVYSVIQSNDLKFDQPVCDYYFTQIDVGEANGKFPLIIERKKTSSSSSSNSQEKTYYIESIDDQLDLGVGSADKKRRIKFLELNYVTFCNKTIDYLIDGYSFSDKENFFSWFYALRSYESEFLNEKLEKEINYLIDLSSKISSNKNNSTIIREKNTLYEDLRVNGFYPFINRLIDSESSDECQMRSKRLKRLYLFYNVIGDEIRKLLEKRFIIYGESNFSKKYEEELSNETSRVINSSSDNDVMLDYDEFLDDDIEIEKDIFNTDSFDIWQSLENEDLISDVGSLLLTWDEEELIDDMTMRKNEMIELLVTALKTERSSVWETSNLISRTLDELGNSESINLGNVVAKLDYSKDVEDKNKNRVIAINKDLKQRIDKRWFDVLNINVIEVEDDSISDDSEEYVFESDSVEEFYEEF